MVLVYHALCSPLGTIYRCSLRLDQHNPFLGTCIGFWNFKYFFLFEFYKLLGTATALAALVLRAINEFHQWDGASTLGVHGLLGAALVLVASITLVYLTYLMVWFQLRVRIMARNFTRLEYFEKAKADDTKVASDGRKVSDIWRSSLFDHGSCCLNMMDFLGSCPLLWFMPLHA